MPGGVPEGRLEPPFCHLFIEVTGEGGNHLTVVDERHHRFYHLDGGGNPVIRPDADRDGIA